MVLCDDDTTIIKYDLGDDVAVGPEAHKPTSIKDIYLYIETSPTKAARDEKHGFIVHLS